MPLMIHAKSLGFIVITHRYPKVLAARPPMSPPRAIKTRLTSTDNDPSPPAVPQDSKEPGVQISGLLQARMQPKKAPLMLTANVLGIDRRSAPVTTPIATPKIAPRTPLRSV